MTLRSSALPALLVSLLAGCVPPPSTSPAIAVTPTREPLYRPERVWPGELVYAPDGSTFAPVLTERFPYPTQRQANRAFWRFAAQVPETTPAAPAAVRLFGCRPGVLDPVTARVTRFVAPSVHCATDLLDAAGRPLRRTTANFRYDGALWSMEPVEPPREPVPWLDREASPRDTWGWVPGRDRYE